MDNVPVKGEPSGLPGVVVVSRDDTTLFLESLHAMVEGVMKAALPHLRLMAARRSMTVELMFVLAAAGSGFGGNWEWAVSLFVGGYVSGVATRFALVWYWELPGRRLLKELEARLEAKKVVR